MVRSTRLDGRAELSVQVVPGQHNRTSLFGRFTHCTKLVTSCQTFVRCCHGVPGLEGGSRSGRGEFSGEPPC